MTSEGSQILAPLSSFVPLSSLGSLMHFPSQQKMMAVTSSTEAGVCILDSGSKLYACWKSATGYHYTHASKDGVFQLTNWTQVGVSKTGIRLVRDDGELYCITAEDKLHPINCASSVTLLAASPTVLWVVASDMIWSRQGMNA